jgi:hypothetical protein
MVMPPCGRNPISALAGAAGFRREARRGELAGADEESAGIQNELPQCHTVR